MELEEPPAKTPAESVIPMINVVFRQSEKSVEGWLGVGFDADTELLGLIHSGQFSCSLVSPYTRDSTSSSSGSWSCWDSSTC